MFKLFIYFYISLNFFNSFLYSQNNYSQILETRLSLDLSTEKLLKRHLSDTKHVLFLIFLIEKFDQRCLLVDAHQDEFFEIKEKTDVLFEREKLLRRLYLDSHNDSENLKNIEKIIKEDSPGLIEVLEKIRHFQKKLCP